MTWREQMEEDMTMDLFEKALQDQAREALIWLEQTLHDYQLCDRRIARAADELIAEYADRFGGSDEIYPMDIAHAIVKQLIPDADLDEV